jgi:uncharacterized membrane protein YjjP (DUF1212 family)
MSDKEIAELFDTNLQFQPQATASAASNPSAAIPQIFLSSSDPPGLINDPNANDALSSSFDEDFPVKRSTIAISTHSNTVSPTIIAEKLLPNNANQLAQPQSILRRRRSVTFQAEEPFSVPAAPLAMPNASIQLLNLSRNTSDQFPSNQSTPHSVKHSLTPQLTPVISDFDPALPDNTGKSTGKSNTAFTFRLPTTRSSLIHMNQRGISENQARATTENLALASNLNKSRSSLVNNMNFSNIPAALPSAKGVSAVKPQAKAYFTEYNAESRNNIKHFNEIQLEIDPEATIDGEIDRETSSLGPKATPPATPDASTLIEEQENELLNQQTMTENNLHSIYKHFLHQTASKIGQNKPTLQEISTMAKQLRSQTNKKIEQKAIHINVEELDLREAKKLFLKVLGKGLYSCGLPMHAVEFYVILAGQRLGLHINCFSLMTTMLISFGSDSTAHLIQPAHPSLSLSKMVDVCGLAEQIIRGESTYEDSMAAVQAVVARKSQYSEKLFLPAMFLVSFLGAPLFNGGWIECIVAGSSGFLTGILELYSSNRNILALARGHDLLAGLISAVLVSLTLSLVSSLNVLAACMAGIFWSLPGLRATLACLDLSTNHYITGTAKLFSTIMTMLNLGIGIAVGLQLQRIIGGNSVDLFTQSQYKLPPWVPWLSCFLCAFPTMILLDAKKSHLAQLVAGCMCAYAVSALAANFIGNTMGTFLAAAAIGIMANLYGRYTANPSIELYLFSIIMLVPGSIGVKSILADNTLTQLSFFFQMIEIAIAIVTGMFCANIVIPPLRSM